MNTLEDIIIFLELFYWACASCFVCFILFDVPQKEYNPFFCIALICVLTVVFQAVFFDIFKYIEDNSFLAKLIFLILGGLYTIIVSREFVNEMDSPYIFFSILFVFTSVISILARSKFIRSKIALL